MTWQRKSTGPMEHWRKRQQTRHPHPQQRQLLRAHTLQMENSGNPFFLACILFFWSATVGMATVTPHPVPFVPDALWFLSWIGQDSRVTGATQFLFSGGSDGARSSDPAAALPKCCRWHRHHGRQELVGKSKIPTNISHAICLGTQQHQ